MVLLVELVVVFFAVGIILGFIGAGGAGSLVALLTTVFHVPIHTAIGTALAAMCVLTITGAISHWREGNIVPRIAIIAGLSGMFGAAVGARFSAGIPERPLEIIAGLALWVLAFLVWLRSRVASASSETTDLQLAGRTPRDVAVTAGIGLSGGAAAAVFGVGMTPYLQLGLLTLIRLPLRITVGTTMFALVFISFGAATALAQDGSVSPRHFVGAVIGLATGSFLGARLTRRLGAHILRGTIFVVPIIAGAMLLFL
jgi:uncharacterized membrane protein YfcA